MFSEFSIPEDKFFNFFYKYFRVYGKKWLFFVRHTFSLKSLSFIYKSTWICYLFIVSFFLPISTLSPMNTELFYQQSSCLASFYTLSYRHWRPRNFKCRCVFGEFDKVILNFRLNAKRFFNEEKNSWERNSRENVVDI